jgi:hypothetical protein
MILHLVTLQIPNRSALHCLINNTIPLIQSLSDVLIQCKPFSTLRILFHIM